MHGYSEREDRRLRDQSQTLAAGSIDRRDWEKGIADLKASAGAGGTFCYTFFKAMAVKSCPKWSANRRRPPAGA